IILDVPVAFDEQALELEEPSKELLEPLFAELEFRTIGKRVFGDDFSVADSKFAVSQQIDMFGNVTEQESKSKVFVVTEEYIEEVRQAKTIENTEHDYRLIDTPELRNELIALLLKQESISFDTETTGTDANTAELVGLSFCIKPGEGYYIPLSANPEEAQPIIDEFKPVWENEAISKIGQNIKYDMLVLKWYGVSVRGKLFDTMLAHYLIDPDTRHGMDVLSENYLNYSPISITSLIGPKGKSQGNMRDVPVEKVVDYAAEDADVTLQLANVFAPMLKELNAEQLAVDVENPLIYVLADIEKEGVRIDMDTLINYSKELELDIRKFEQNVYDKCGVKFNLASPKQLGEVLFDKLCLDPKAKKTKTGQYQTGEDVLLALSHKSDVVKDILEFRQLQKLKSTYVDALPQMVNPKTGRVHTSYNQAVAATGRLSSNNPNLQNIPIR
ncbi:MAG: DNA polymerase I, partial [Pedobacter sp.]